MTRLSESLEAEGFSVTCELNPPKGVDLGQLYRKAEMLSGMVDAFNLTDSAGSRMTMGNIAAAHLLVDRGIEPILQLACRDRNRLALQSELLAAYALGIANVLCMTGDPPSSGDHPDAKPVFDLDAITLLRAIKSLGSGTDMASNELRGSPHFYAGAVVNPGARDLDEELRRMEEKIEAGASFFQSQAVYDPAGFESFMNVAQRYRVPVLAGVIVLKSATMARNLNANLPGVHVPDDLIREMDEAEDREQTGVAISARTIREIEPMCAGVHIMAIGWESKVPQILREAGLIDD